MNLTKTESGFIKISTELRRRTDLSSTEKMILGYLLSYQSNNLVCYQTEDEISIELGLSLSTLKRSIVNLIQLGIIIKEKASKYTGKRQYKNRKAIIVVSDDNTAAPIETIQSEEKAAQTEEKLSTDDLINYAYIECSVKRFNYELYDKVKGMINDNKITSEKEIDLQLN